MGIHIETHFFLGANSPAGYCSLYDRFVDILTGENIYILKGGPDRGKSAFMKIIADNISASGYSTEFIHCSGDPDSLDGVKFPELGIAFADGAAPHVAELVLPGATGSYIDLGAYTDSDALRPHRERLLSLCGEYKLQNERAFSLISAAYSAMDGIYDSLVTEAVRSIIAKRTRGILSRELRSSGKAMAGKTNLRFLGALTGKGHVCLWDTVKALASRIYTLDNEFGLSHLMLKDIAETASSRGYETVLCPSPLCPEKLEHCIIPELSLAFVSITGDLPYPGDSYRHIRLDALPDNSLLSGLKRHAALCRKCSDSLYSEAIRVLDFANTIRSDIESIYTPHVDFDKIYALAQIYTEKILPKSAL